MDFDLTDEQQLIRETARDFTDKEIVPRRARERPQPPLRPRPDRQDRRPGLPGRDRPPRLRRRGSGLPDLRAHRRGGRPRRLGHAHRGLRPDLAGLLLAGALGLRRSEAALPAQALLGRVAGLLRAHRARHRLRRRQPANAGAQDRLGVDAQRQQDVDLHGEPRQGRADLRPDRSRTSPPRSGLLLGGDRHRRVLHPGDPRQDGPARLGHRLAGARRRRGARRGVDGRDRRRLQGRHERAGLGPLQRGGRLRGDLPGVAGRLGRPTARSASSSTGPSPPSSWCRR